MWDRGHCLFVCLPVSVAWLFAKCIFNGNIYRSDEPHIALSYKRLSPLKSAEIALCFPFPGSNFSSLRLSARARKTQRHTEEYKWGKRKGKEKPEGKNVRVWSIDPTMAAEFSCICISVEIFVTHQRHPSTDYGGVHGGQFLGSSLAELFGQFGALATLVAGQIMQMVIRHSRVCPIPPSRHFIGHLWRLCKRPARSRRASCG